MPLPAEPYLTFLFDLGTLEKVPGSVRRAPDPREPADRQWRVIREGERVAISAPSAGTIARARWNDGVLDDRIDEPGGPTINAAQWGMIEAILQFETAPPPSVTPPGYVTFLIDRQSGQVIDGSVSDDPSAQFPENPFQWKIICDSRGEVSVREFATGRPRLIATAIWDRGELVQRCQHQEELPSATKWTMIQTTLARELASRARRGPPDPTRIEVISKREAGTLRGRDTNWKSLGPRFDQNGVDLWAMRRFKWWLVGGMVALIGGMTIIFVVFRWKPPADTAPASRPTPVAASTPTPTPPAPTLEQRVRGAASFAEALTLSAPQPDLLAHYAKLRWADVEGVETSLGLVQRDADSERGKRMCVEGDLESIVRKELGARKVYAGRLKLADGDGVTFTAVGSAGELVKRMPARFCGAVIGAAGTDVVLVGMFDLPDNRNPVVEAP